MWVFHLICVIFVLRAEAAYQYDCRRLDDCGSGTCTFDGSCICQPGFTGSTCKVPENPTECESNTCTNGGVCYVEDGQTKCSCPYGFLGDTCEIKQADVECGGNTVKYDFNFPASFDGAVTLDESEAIPEVCRFTDSTDNGIKTFTLTIVLNDITDLTSFCGNDYVTLVADESVPTFRRNVRIQYSPLTIVSEVDEVAVMTCIHRDDGSNEMSAVISSVSVDSIGNLTIIDQDDTYSPVEFILLDGSQQPMSAATELYVGDTLYLHLYLTDTIVYKNLRIQTSIANDTSASSPKVFSMFDQGCPTKSGKKTSAGQVVLDKTDGATILPGKAIKVKAFKFYGTDKLGLMVTAILCKEGDNRCDVPTEEECEAIINPSDSGDSGATGGDTGTTGGDTGTTGGETGTTGGDTGTTGGDTGTTGGDTGTTGGDTGTTGGDTVTTGGDTGTTGGDTGTTGGDTGTTGGDTGTTGGATGTTGGDTGTTGGDTGTTGGDTGTTGGDIGTTGGDTGTTGGDTGTTGGDTGTTGGDTGTTGGDTGTTGGATGATEGDTTPTGGDTGATEEATTGLKRRRRRAAEDDDGKRTVSTVLTVRGPGDVASSASKGKAAGSSIEDCLATSSVRAILIVLGVVVCILFIACLVLGMCLIRRRQKRYEDTVYGNGHSFQIPRAHVNAAFIGT